MVQVALRMLDPPLNQGMVTDSSSAIINTGLGFVTKQTIIFDAEFTYIYATPILKLI